MKDEKKRKKNVTFTIFLQKILSRKLSQAVFYGKKIILIVVSN